MILGKWMGVHAMILLPALLAAQTTKLLNLMWQDNNYGQNKRNKKNVCAFFLCVSFRWLHRGFHFHDIQTYRQHRFNSMIAIISHVENACIEFMHRSRFFLSVLQKPLQFSTTNETKRATAFQLKNRRKCATKMLSRKTD